MTEGGDDCGNGREPQRTPSRRISTRAEMCLIIGNLLDKVDALYREAEGIEEARALFVQSFENPYGIVAAPVFDTHQRALEGLQLRGFCRRRKRALHRHRSRRPLRYFGGRILGSGQILIVHGAARIERCAPVGSIGIFQPQPLCVGYRRYIHGVTYRGSCYGVGEAIHVGGSEHSAHCVGMAARAEIVRIALICGFGNGAPVPQHIVGIIAARCPAQGN